MKYVDPLSVRKAHPSLDTYSRKVCCWAKNLGGRGESIGGGGIGEEPEGDGSDYPGEMEDNSIEEQLEGPEIG